MAQKSEAAKQHQGHNSSVELEDGERHYQADTVAKLDRAINLLDSIPTLRRYGDDEAAVKEVQEILKELRGHL